MEVVRAGVSGGVAPYQRRDVEEWSHRDHLTGILEHARVETDHWATNTHNTAHKYGKVVDSRDRCAPDGTKQQRQRRQLEVFQAHVPGASIQLIRTSSKWSSTARGCTSAAPTSHKSTAADGQHFDNLQLALYPLDLSSQKTKASVGRSGSIGGRRPPSRPRSITEDVPTRLHNVTRLCQQLHDHTVTNATVSHIEKQPTTRSFVHNNTKVDGSVTNNCSNNYEKDFNECSKPPVEQFSSNDGRSPQFLKESKSIKQFNNNYEEEFKNGCSKSSSPVSFHKNSTKKITSAEQFPSTDRKSPQYLKESKLKNEKNINGCISKSPSPVNFSKNLMKPVSGEQKTNVWNKYSSNHLSQQNNKKTSSKPDLETGRRLSTALRGTNIDLDALDQILKTISCSPPSSNIPEQPEKETSNPQKDLESKNKRESFITVESLQEVRGRLRRLSSPTDDFYKFDKTKEEEPDDGIVAEDNSMMKKEEANAVLASNTGMSRVRSYVYGMEAMLHKKPIIGTGSLESRTSNKSSGTSTSRSEDWYNRRKSYGFEQVHNQQIDQSNSISLRGKNKIESSTDSGICRSIEIVVVPSSSLVKTQNGNEEVEITNSDNTNCEEQTTNRYNSYKSVPIYNKTGTSTVINLGGDKNKCNNSALSSVSVNVDTDEQYPKQTNNELFSIWNKRASLSSETQADKLKKDSEQITITIPIVSEDESSNSNIRRVFHRQLSEGTSISVESSWANKQNDDPHDVKRHSIAVDESKYVNCKNQFQQIRRTSLAMPDNYLKSEDAFTNDGLDDEMNNHFSKKQKKVEFCKTEVHFAAESGKVNIVETDGKPPPNNNFRNRRRRNSSVTTNHYSEEFNKNGLPLIHFGDTSYEKKLFGVSDHENVISQQVESPESFNTDIKSYNVQESAACNNNTVTVSSVSITNDYEPELKENHESEYPPRGILKNKLIKPKPYILGDNNNELLLKEGNEEQESSIWGVRLRPVHKQEETAPIWRSTVTVQNTAYNKPGSENISEPITQIHNNNNFESKNSDNSQPEFQKLLNSLRPARKSEPSIVSSESISDQKLSASIESRRSSWSVADLVRQVEDLRTESKGYSTKVNFGSGEATVVENVDVEKQTTWPSNSEEAHNKDDTKHSSILNKGLVVRIGREDSNHTVCSKTTTNHNSNSTTTTTKITIDMSPSPTNADKYPSFSAIKLPRASLHSLKSTSLIMNTFVKPENIINIHNKFSRDSVNSGVKTIPDQLAALRKLYDEAAEHSDDSQKADEEVRSYMSGGGDESDVHETEDEVSSVVSGSWSKMRAFKNINQHLSNIHCDSSRQKEKEMFRNIINRHALIKKDFPSTKQTFQTSAPKRTVINPINEKRSPAESKTGSISVRCSLDRKSSDTSLTDSPQPERRQINPKKTFESLKTQYSNGSLSSPSLVGSSIQKSTRSFQSKKTESVIHQTKSEDKRHTSEERASAFSKIQSSQLKESPSLGKKYLVRKTPSYTNNQSLYSKRNELAGKKLDSSGFYNEIQPPKPTKKLPRDQKPWKDNKPDLLQHYGDTRQYVNLSSVIKESSKSSIASKSNIDESKNTTKKSVRPDSPSVERADSPIYENIDEVLSGLSSGIEKESSILQELTKAADQILQAVNGYTDDDSTKLSTDDEDDSKKHRIKNFKKTGEILSTISETKSWKVQNTKKTEVKNIKNVRNRVRPTSSTSSIESVTCQKSVSRQNKLTKTNEDKSKKKITGSNSELSKATKARRLQRASSREALLQSHGSSSEDISTSAEITRKPRLVRRLKTQNSTTSDDVNSNCKKSTVSQPNVRRRECDIRRNSDRLSVTGLQEIRHKTAISTIKSTAEKAASREKGTKSKNDELRKRVSARRDTNSSKGGSIVSSQQVHQQHVGYGRAALSAGGRGGGGGAMVMESCAAVRTSSGVTNNNNEKLLTKQMDSLDLNSSENCPSEELVMATASTIVKEDNSRRRSLRKRIRPAEKVDTKRRVTIKPTKRNTSENEDLEPIKITNLYICKDIKIKPLNLETIFEEPKVTSNNEVKYIGIKKLKRFISFEPNNTGKIKKRQAKIKKYFGRNILKKKRGTMEALIEKLNIID